MSRTQVAARDERAQDIADWQPTVRPHARELRGEALRVDRGLAAGEQGIGAAATPLTDLDSAAEIARFIDNFYARVLNDPLLAPLFIEHAGIELTEHLPRIKAYWRKMLLGEQGYRRHMMRKHRELDARRPFDAAHYARWLMLFEHTLEKHHRGPYSERAGALARRVAGNMRRNLEGFRGRT